MAARIQVLPLRWKKHHAMNNSCYGVAPDGAAVCYIYQPVDMRVLRGPYPWDVYCYFGTDERPLTGRGRFGKFTSRRSAKIAAQLWWKEAITACIRRPLRARRKS